jgi:diguanylate cyclase (GGDEF)-like protein/PAS domain S-box-containing protein
MSMIADPRGLDHGVLPQNLSRTLPAAAHLKQELDALIARDSSVFGFLMDVSLDGIWFWNLEAPDNGWMSPRFWELLGYDPADMAHFAGDWSKLMHPDAAGPALETFAAYCRNPDHVFDELLRYRHCNGGSVWLRCRGVAIRDASGKAVRLLGAHNDITALKRNEDELRRGKAELSELLAKSAEANASLQMAEQIGHIGHWRLSVPDGLLTWSAEIYRIHGLTPETYTPDLDSAIGHYHPEDRALVQSSIVRAMRDGTAFEFSARLRHSDGNFRHVQSRGVTQPGPNGTTGLIVGVLIDLTEQRQMERALRVANAQLERIAHVDSLTGLANRRRFDDALETEWRRAVREHNPLSLVILDIDRFKAFNDLYGHPAGDDCLRRVASVLNGAGKRPGDLAARYGGEEMVLLLPATTAVGAEKMARDARSAIAALCIAHEGNLLCGGVVTASFGVATAMPWAGWDSPDSADLVAEADRMLYEAKRTGRNKVVTQASMLASGAVPVGADEEARLAALATYEQAGAAERTQDIDRIARLAAMLTGAPIGLVSLLDRNEQRFVGNFGLEGQTGMPRDLSLCAHTILGDEPMVVADATCDLRFKDNALVAGDFGLRYYAGASIVSQSTGYKLGTLCILDKVARDETSLAHRALLTDLAGMAAALIEDKAKA